MENIITFKGIKPRLTSGCYVAPNAIVLGDVEMGKDSNIWFNCVVRGDIEKIVIGESTNIQDGCILHTSDGTPLTIGKEVTVGHGAIIHGCTIGDSCLVGMGSIVMDGAVIGKNSLIAAGSIVPPGKKYPDGSFIQGIPGRLKRELSKDEIENYSSHYKHYIKYKEDYKENGL